MPNTTTQTRTRAADFVDRLSDQLRMALPRLKDEDVLDLADMLHEALRTRRAEHHLAHERRML